jgi:hypothetical protein
MTVRVPSKWGVRLFGQFESDILVDDLRNRLGYDFVALFVHTAVFVGAERPADLSDLMRPSNDRRGNLIYVSVVFQ